MPDYRESVKHKLSLDYKEVLLTTLSTNYIAYQSFFVRFSKSFFLRRKNLTTDKKSFGRNILTTPGKFSQQNKNSHRKVKIFTAKILTVKEIILR